jgi:hypothetical protein
MRVFEKTAEGNTWRLVLSDSGPAQPTCIDGPRKGAIGGLWNLRGVETSDWGWREITPTDITKLDTAGVFHESPKQPEAWRFFYCRESPQDIAVSVGPLKGDHGDRWVEFSSPDIANATIAELRQKVAELERQVTKANNRAEMEFLERQLAATKRIEHYDNCLCELRRQLQAAWMRNDLKTADRIADLIGDKRPSEHEAADAGEVRA